jgi:hypothetical protein
MANRNNPDSEQDEQERLEQERRERAAALRGELRQSPGSGDDGPDQDSSKNPVIINKINK